MFCSPATDAGQDILLPGGGTRDAVLRLAEPRCESRRHGRIGGGRQTAATLPLLIG